MIDRALYSSGFDSNALKRPVGAVLGILGGWW
jgi:hypothetical protein